MNRKPLPPPPPALADWLRRGPAPSAFRRHWRLYLAIILLLAAASCLVRWGGLLSGWQQAALWGALVSAIAFLSRRAWGRLFGPVLFYDLVRTARRGRGFVLRGAYALALLVVLALVYATEFGQGTLFDSLFGEARAGIQELADFGSGFFLTFLSVQLAAVFLLTPAFTATAIAEEKERKTLDYLLATDLSNREIVLGKLASRLLAMLLLLLGGLPVLSFVQFLGGVDPNLVLAGFVATAVSMLSLGSLGIVYSVYADRSLHAVLSTYVMAALYLILSSCCGGMAIRSGYFAPVVWPAAGNVFIAYFRIENSAGSSGGMTGAAVMPVLAEYVIFHGVAALLLAGLATAKLRGWYREARPKSEREALLATKAPAPANPLSLSLPRLPRVGPDPVLWKELYAEHGLRPPPLVRGLLTFVAVAFLFGAGMVYLCGILISLAFHEPSAFATSWVRAVGTTVSCLMVLGVGLRAATALSRERERQTLDSLLTTPLSNAAILGGKWWGAVRSVAPAGWCLAAVWGLGFLAGGLHVISVVLLLAAWCAYAAFAAGMGLWFSLHCRTTVRAIAWTLVALLLAGTLPLLLCGSSGLALTPEGALAYLAFGWGEWYTFEPALRSSAGQVALAWAGVCGYALAAGTLWLAVGVRFGPVTGRA